MLHVYLSKKTKMWPSSTARGDHLEVARLPTSKQKQISHIYHCPEGRLKVPDHPERSVLIATIFYCNNSMFPFNWQRTMELYSDYITEIYYNNKKYKSEIYPMIITWTQYSMSVSWFTSMMSQFIAVRRFKSRDN